ncbi:hypothetical protein BGZ68_007698 [Mortierella alpina]|nr:hypothetical protein BGZ68_007698 [Mortierella alpina]
MNIQVNTHDLHVAIVPSVAVEFTTIIDSGDMESPVSPSSDRQDTFVVKDAEEPSPMDNEEFAYPTNLTSEVLDYEDEEGEQAAPGSIAHQRRSTAGLSGSKMFSLDDVDDDMARGHFRANNPSTGSDLIQVTVEDLLISEEQDRTMKASIDLCRQEQEHHPPTTAPLLSTSSNGTKNTVTTTTITATIRSNGPNKKAISFDDMNRKLDSTEQGLPKKSPASTQNQQKITESRVQQPPTPPAPRTLTPAQQREAEADSNIQKAIELHENNQLEEATHHFWLAAQSENPLGQLMYGLSLRHGWGCKPNPTEAIQFLQRAAEYAMGELNELGPVQPKTSPAISITAAPSSTEMNQQQDQQPVRHQKSNSNPTQQTLRRMGSMDRTAAMITARKELVMALYELGMSYLKGWGVTKDKSVAFTYFKIAADLGDPDSQNETAMCYYEGIGTDKDMYQSAKYYRMAAAQGASQLGNSWIWKPKYDLYCAAENAAAVAVGGAGTTSVFCIDITLHSKSKLFGLNDRLGIGVRDGGDEYRYCRHGFFDQATYRGPVFYAIINNNSVYDVLGRGLEVTDIQHILTVVQGLDRVLSHLTIAAYDVLDIHIFNSRGKTRNGIAWDGGEKEGSMDHERSDTYP